MHHAPLLIAITIPIIALYPSRAVLVTLHVRWGVKIGMWLKPAQPDIARVKTV